MSLKAFHIVFIVAAAFTSLFFGLWAIRDWQATGDRTVLVLGIVSFAVLVALVPYGIWFLRKMKNISYL